jgi:hypothetical protein
VCWKHDTCTLTRQCWPSERTGRPGRPVGLTWSFLASAHKYGTKLEHVNSIYEWGDLEARSRARADFLSHPKSADYEIAEHGGAGLGEPRIHDG